MNLTLRDQYDLMGRFFKMAIANVLSILIIPLASTLSVIFLGHLTEIHHLAGVALASTLLSCLYQALLFLRMGTTGITAQAVRRNDREDLLLVLLRSSLLALVVGIALVLLQYPIREIGIALLDITPEVKASLIACFNAQIWGTPAILLNFVLFGWFLGREHNNKVLLLAFIGNVANMVCDYVFIVRWNLASTGAGLSQTINQYLTLLVGLFFICKEINWQELQALKERIWDNSAIKSILVLNGNIFVSRLVTLFTFLTFNYESVALGTIIYTQNALLLQIVLLSYACFEGLGFGVETLSGNFKGNGTNEQLVTLVTISVATSMLVGFMFSGASVLFPMTVFGLLTNHTEVLENIDIYVPWLLLVLGFSSINFMLNGYYLGLAEGHTIRNSALISTLLGFMPAAITTFLYQNNHILWLAMSLFPGIGVVFLGVQLFRTFRSNITVDGVSILATGGEISEETDLGISKN